MALGKSPLAQMTVALYVSLMFWMALAMQVSAPAPTNLNSWFSDTDVPEYLLDRGSGQWQVGVRLDVDPSGALRSCEIETSSGIPDLDALSCGILQKRAKFHAARSADGSPSFGAYRTSVKWIVADSPWDTSRINLADLNVTVQKLPEHVKSPSWVRVMFAVDQHGRPSSCTVDSGPALNQVDNNPALVPIACEQIVRSYIALPAKDASGNAVPSVQDATVRFTKE